MMLSGVAGDSLESDSVVEHQMREEAPLLVRTGWIVGEVESVFLEGRPEEFRRERVVHGVISSDHDGHFQGTPDRVRVLSVKQLHEVPRDFPGYLAKRILYPILSSRTSLLSLAREPTTHAALGFLR
jgi:hypothetical protein